MQLLAGLGPLGLPELAIVLVIVVLIFGVGRLPEVGGAIGKGIREFRHATKDDEHADTTSNVSVDGSGSGAEAQATAAAQPVAEAQPAAAAPETIFCGECGARNPRSAKFCAECGKAIGAPVS